MRRRDVITLHPQSADTETMSSKSCVDAILAQFPGPVILYPSRRKYLLMLIGSLIFVVGEIWIIWGTGDSGPRGPALFLFGGGLIFFGWCAIVFSVMLLPGAGGLRLDREGFETTRLFRHHRSRWQDVSGFDLDAIRTVYPRYPHRVVYNDKNPSGRFTGGDATLPSLTYGFSAAKLADLMNRWRWRALLS
jgi:hypothetical protein